MAKPPDRAWDDDDEPIWPEPTGVAEVLTERGFTLDTRVVAGNIHYEEYW